jgi:precorrin-2 dehydrogenase / sirohydrochlorin ferrochelatase
MPSLFPMFLKLEGRECLVVGAGAIAKSKVASLAEAGARITVVAPRASERIRRLAASGAVRWVPREFRANDLVGIFLAIAGTSDVNVNREVFLEAQRRGILCNAVDDPPHCDFYFPAVVRRGDLQIAISTSGQSPALAQRLRVELDGTLDASLGDWVAEIGSSRRQILSSEPPSEARKQRLTELAYTARLGAKP